MRSNIESVNNISVVQGVPVESDLTLSIHMFKSIWKFKALGCKSEKSASVAQTNPPVNQRLVTHWVKGADFGNF